MKNLILAFFSCLFSAAAIAQTDSTGKKMTPPDFNNDTINSREGVRTRDSIYDNKKAVPDNTRTKTQDDKKISQPTRENPVKVNATHDGVMRRDGKLLIIKNGQATELREPLSLANGSRVMPDGTLIGADGSNVKLKEGDYLDFSGKFVHRNPSEQPRTPGATVPSDPSKPVKNDNDYNKDKNKDSYQNKDGKVREEGKEKNKNMYLVPDSTVKDIKKDQ